MLSGSEPLLENPSLLNPEPDGSLDLDLTELIFVSPFELVALASWSTSIPDAARGTVSFGLSPCASYLQRMRLLERLVGAGWTVGEVEPQPYEDLPESLLEITALNDPYEVEELADRLPRLWAGKAGDPRKSRALHFAFGELSDNATTHSGDSPIFVSAQRYTGQTSPHAARLELAVGDGGIGIPAHLRGNPAYAQLIDDREAIAKALQPGVTGTSDRRGYGFHDVLTELGEVGSGEMVLASGGALVHVPFGGLGRRRTSRALPTPVNGTWIQVRLYE